MTLDYIQEINEYGDDLVRLFDFDKSEAILFRDAIQESILLKNEELDLASLSFVQLNNYNLILVIGEEDDGIFSNRENNFICSLTLASYEKMLTLLEPFCTKETKGYQYLYDLDSPTDFLFSPAGTNSFED
ncbi:MAG: hypothetical protein IPK10_14185 [Bacteroidetes bacterium]|nr:hypothetical protein [Bacteroidota bacterium]